MTTTQEYSTSVSFLKPKDFTSRENIHNSDPFISQWSQTKTSWGISDKSIAVDNHYFVQREKLSVSENKHQQNTKSQRHGMDSFNSKEQKHRTTLLFLKEEDDKVPKKPKTKLNKESSLKIHREQTCVGLQVDKSDRVTSNYIPSAFDKNKDNGKPGERTHLMKSKGLSKTVGKSKRSTCSITEVKREDEDHFPIVLLSPTKDGNDLSSGKNTKNLPEIRQLPRRSSSTRRVSQTTNWTCRTSEAGSARSGRNSEICPLNSRFQFKGEVNKYKFNRHFFPDWQNSVPTTKLQMIRHALLSTNFNTLQSHLLLW